MGPQCLVLTVRFVNFTLKCTTKRTVRRCEQESIIMKLFPFYLFHRFYFGASTIPSTPWNTHTHITLLSWLEGNIRKSIKNRSLVGRFVGAWAAAHDRNESRYHCHCCLLRQFGVIGKHWKGESELVQNWGYLTSLLSLFILIVLCVQTPRHYTRLWNKS